MFVYLLVDRDRRPLHGWTAGDTGGVLERDLAKLGILDHVTKIEVSNHHMTFLIAGGAEPFALVPAHELAQKIERESLGLYVPDYKAGGPNLDHRLTPEEVQAFLTEQGRIERVEIKRSPGMSISRVRLGAPFPARLL